MAKRGTKSPLFPNLCKLQAETSYCTFVISPMHSTFKYSKFRIRGQFVPQVFCVGILWLDIAADSREKNEGKTSLHTTCKPKHLHHCGTLAAWYLLEFSIDLLENLHTHLLLYWQVAAKIWSSKYEWPRYSLNSSSWLLFMPISTLWYLGSMISPRVFILIAWKNLHTHLLLYW
jgi:hypothetical protein